MQRTRFPDLWSTSSLSGIKSLPRGGMDSTNRALDHFALARARIVASVAGYFRLFSTKSGGNKVSYLRLTPKQKMRFALSCQNETDNFMK